MNVEPGMPQADAQTVASLLREFGQRTALRGGNPYRAKAYLRAAENLAALSLPLDRIIKANRLTEIPGIGEAIADIVKQMYRSGTHPALEKMRGEIPAGVLDLLRLPGLRTEKMLKLYKELGIDSLGSLEEAARAGHLKAVRGLGAAFETKVLQSLDTLKNGEGRRHMHRANELLDAAATSLKRTDPSVLSVQPAGDFRRGCELVSDLSLVATLKGRVKPADDATGGLRIVFTPKAAEGAALLAATGSGAHWAKLQARAEDKGLRLDEKGLWRGRTRIAAADESGIYRALDLDYIPPELREGGEELTLAAKGALPNLVEDGDLRGVLHAHTVQSDGVHTLDQMVKATQARGYEYFGVADHSQSAHYAGGLKPEEIEAQHLAIDRLNKKIGSNFKVFKGIEADILADGSLDYPSDILARFDFIVASVHSRFRLDRTEQTKRILRAVANPYTTILGHMTGRQLLRRPGYDVDIETILKACAKHGVAVEINANPWRLDLDWRWHRRALALGCAMCINPDAHSTRELDLIHWGVQMARKGGVPKERVLNCLSAAQIAKHFAMRRSAAKRARTTRRLAA
jgi:DNA polymerase (family 10)